MTIFVSGSIARDIIMDFPGRFADHIHPEKIHVLSLSFAVNNLQENRGGTAANICYNLSLLDERPYILGSVGKDGKELKIYLHKLKIGTQYLEFCKNQHTAAAYIITDRDDNQIAGFYAGAMNEAASLPKVKEKDWAIIAPENPKNMIKLAKHYTAKKVNYIFDPGQQITSMSNRDLETGIGKAEVLIGNDYEIGLLERRIKVKVPILVKTRGPRGSEIYCGRKKIKIGIAKPRRVLDPTGAGDAYRAGFLKGLILGYNLKSCGQLAATVASFAVEKYGTQKHRFTFKNVVKRHNKNFINKLSLRGPRRYVGGRSNLSMRLLR